ncbi:hypothetical protein LY78DRAFT_277195 [Colletotrichum sublineola]|nr:hypothetical protein LY78DRAFT_277195 [Colletotrichum sublineola]
MPKAVGFSNPFKVKESDTAFVIITKAMKPVIRDQSLTHFQSMEGFKANEFANRYGGCFVSSTQPSLGGIGN